MRNCWCESCRTSKPKIVRHAPTTGRSPHMTDVVVFLHSCENKCIVRWRLKAGIAIMNLLLKVEGFNLQSIFRIFRVLVACGSSFVSSLNLKRFSLMVNDDRPIVCEKSAVGRQYWKTENWWGVLSSHQFNFAITTISDGVPDTIFVRWFHCCAKIIEMYKSTL